jgi:hypothetical protein
VDFGVFSFYQMLDSYSNLSGEYEQIFLIFCQPLRYFDVI